MSEAPTQAALALESPDEEMTNLIGAVKDGSAANQTEARADRAFDDGSVVVVRCWKGGQVHTAIYESVEEASGPEAGRSLPEALAELESDKA